MRPGVQQLLDAMHDVPAFVQNGRLDIIATNHFGRARCSPSFYVPAATTGQLRPIVFLDKSAHEPSTVTRDDAAQQTVPHCSAPKPTVSPHDRDLSDLVGSLSTRSEDFRPSGPPTMSATTAPV